MAEEEEELLRLAAEVDFLCPLLTEVQEEQVRPIPMDGTLRPVLHRLHQDQHLFQVPDYH